MENLQQNLYMKKELRFHPNGNFKIMMLSDIQEGIQYDIRTLENLEKALEKEKPDFVILGGDNCDGTILKTKDELKQYLDIFTRPMEMRKVPWAHVFGNHDHDLPVDDRIMQEIYESFPYCISKHTEGIHGTTNFVLSIKASNTEETIFHIWGIDTNNEIEDLKIGLKKQIYLSNVQEPVSQWNIIYFDQLMWYWNSSIQLEEFYQKKINGIVVTHIAPWESKILKDNPIDTKLTGSTIEKLGLSALNSGFFSTVLQRGDIRCIACGHSHENTFSGTFCDIQICLDGCAGYHAYGKDELRGVRIFELEEQNLEQIKTRMVYYKDL